MTVRINTKERRSIIISSRSSH